MPCARLPSVLDVELRRAAGWTAARMDGEPWLDFSMDAYAEDALILTYAARHAGVTRQRSAYALLR
jgi:hypothetical protein